MVYITDINKNFKNTAQRLTQMLSLSQLGKKATPLVCCPYS